MCPPRRRHLHVLTPAVDREGDPAQLVDPDGGDRSARRDGGDDGGDRHWFAGCRHATRLPDVEPVYGTVIQLARLAWRLQGLTFTVTGVENLPVTGGAVVAINHTSYFDFTFAGLPAYKQKRGRKVRFMAKKEVFDHKITGPIMRSLRHIEVDRAQRRGVVRRGVPASSRKANWSASTRRPRSAAASRSRSSSPARPAWPSPPTCRSFRTSSGAHSGSGPRATRRTCGGPKVPISVAVGEPIPPTLPATELTALLHSRMQHLLEQVQDAYGPHPPGEFWVPHRLGGGAPSLAEANQMDAEEAAEKAARREQRGPAGAPE